MEDKTKIETEAEQVIIVEEDASETTFISSDCPVQKITVYSDRAEVCRVINVKPKKGINEIVMRDLPSCIDGDSMRVEGRGEATIEEVSYQVKYISEDQADLNQKQKDLKDLEKALKTEKEELQSVLTVLKKQWEILNGFAKTATAGFPIKDSIEKTTVLNDAYFTGINKFLSLYKTEGESLEKSRLTYERKLIDLDCRIEANTNNLSQILNNISQKESRECTIVLDASSETPVELVVSYVVSNASWLPSYDIRMFTAEGVLKIMYYGQIEQSTGEDWIDAKIFLSTASPSIGGSVPDLESVVLSLAEKYRSQSKGFFRKHMGRKSFHSFDYAPNPNYFTVPDDSLLKCSLMEMTLDSFPPKPLPVMEATKAKVADSTTSTSYEIARKATIPSDSIQHKVSVGIIDLKPRLEYITVPKKVPRAFLTAKLTNTSQFTLLQGPTSIFLDNSFVAKAKLKSVSPQEEFECSLGVDPSVRVVYKPLKKYQETTGFISKQRSMMHQQDIEIKNTHEYPIQILVKDNLPQSGVDKIKVNLVQPVIDLKHPEKNKDTRLNPKQNHIEWDLTVEKQESTTITLKYTVEHPFSEEIDHRATMFEDKI